MWLKIKTKHFLRWQAVRVDLNEVVEPPKSDDIDALIFWASGIIRSMAARCVVSPLPDDWQIVGIRESTDSFGINIIIESREFKPLGPFDLIPEIEFTMIARPLSPWT